MTQQEECRLCHRGPFEGIDRGEVRSVGLPHGRERRVQGVEKSIALVLEGLLVAVELALYLGGGYHSTESQFRLYSQLGIVLTEFFKDQVLTPCIISGRSSQNRKTQPKEVPSPQ